MFLCVTNIISSMDYGQNNVILSSECAVRYMLTALISIVLNSLGCQSKLWAASFKKLLFLQRGQGVHVRLPWHLWKRKRILFTIMMEDKQPFALTIKQQDATCLDSETQKSISYATPIWMQQWIQRIFQSNFPWSNAPKYSNPTNSMHLQSNAPSNQRIQRIQRLIHQWIQCLFESNESNPPSIQRIFESNEFNPPSGFNPTSSPTHLPNPTHIPIQRLFQSNALPSSNPTHIQSKDFSLCIFSLSG